MIDKTDILNTIGKAALIGTGIVLGANIGCLAVGHILTREEPSSQGVGVITLAFAIIALIDFLFGFVLKRKLLAPLFNQSRQIELPELRQTSIKVSVITAAVCAAMPVYGLAAVIIDGNINVLVGFAIASLAGFMILRLRPGDFKKLKIEDHRARLE